ncbi:MAG: glycerol-3-phosphate dehydrogenase/oxidase [Thermoflexales bacterium]|nr:glycerol-3-phosphate dehydrogenase/oxidase [Thermoflexales bacterium]
MSPESVSAPNTDPRRDAQLSLARAGGTWDVLIIGGGATGLGAAVDAAARGYRTLLVEKTDFGKGTSSRATKLAHGGVRYLAQGNISLVFNALHERGRMFRNAPHLAHPLPLVVPAYTWWSQPFYGPGLLFYSVLAGKLGVGVSKIVSRAEALRLAPTLNPNGLRGGVVYWDGQFDDTRYAMTLVRTLQDRGGVALNYASVVGLIKEGGKVVGARVRDTEGGVEFEVRARVVINATGVWVDDVRQMDEPGARATVAPSQGIHFIIDKRFLPGDHAIMIPKTDDGRVLFALPWRGAVVVGTTDTPVKQRDEDPLALEAETEFLFAHMKRYLAAAPEPSEVKSVFAGLRPLVKAADDAQTKTLSRDHTIMIGNSGLVTITGGKWTTYRHMGADVINKAAALAGLPERPSITETMTLHGATREPLDFPLDVYGTDGAAVQTLCQSRPEWARPLHEALPYRMGEVVWAVRQEMARTVEDVLARRTRSLLLDARASSSVAPAIAAVLAAELGRDAAWEREQVAQYQALARRYLVA